MKRLYIFMACIAICTFVIAWAWHSNSPELEKEKGIVELKDSIYPNAEEYKMMALLYVQTSAEYRALCYQAFHLARIVLDDNLGTNQKRNAVVFDIDETVLDNSPWQAAAIIGGYSYPVCWEEWCMQADAEPIPGVIDFINELKSEGIEVFYISNRKEKYREVTKDNFEKVGLGKVPDDHLLLRDQSSSKVERTKSVAETYHIALLVGDNLADFDEIFEAGTAEERVQKLDSMKQEMGNRFILLPNPIYGNWENAIYGNSSEDKRVQRFKAIKPALCD